MIKEWAMVVSWQNGLTAVSCDVRASCDSCASQAGRKNRALNKLGPQTTHITVVLCDEPLTPDQEVELGIAEDSLLGLVMLVCMSPLAGLFPFATLFQVLFGSDLTVLSGAVLGGMGGSPIACRYSCEFAERETWQSVILDIVFPPGLIRIETQQRYPRPMALCLSGLQRAQMWA